MSHTATCALDPHHTHEDEEHVHDHSHVHGPLVERSIIRSRAGIKAVLLSLGVLTVTAAAQTRSSTSRLASGSPLGAPERNPEPSSIAISRTPDIVTSSV